eukprot:Awhi_evm1s14985
MLLIVCITILISAYAVNSESCGSHFTSLDFECKQAGLIKGGNANKACIGAACSLSNCCQYSTPQRTPTIKPQVSSETCGSHFTSLDFECKQAGLIKGGNANKVCIGAACSLSNCCQYSTPQRTPTIKPQVSSETCGSHFTSLDFECKQAGLIKGGDANKVCIGKACALSNCCQYSTPQKTPPNPTPKRTTCLNYYDDHGRSVCTRNGYRHRRNGSITCSGHTCTLSECCKDPVSTQKHYSTCNLYFNDHGSSVCSRNGYYHRRGDSTKCNDYGYDVCSKYGYYHRHGDSTKCKGSSCTLSECCKDPVPRTTTCKSYFDDHGYSVCSKNGYYHHHGD